MARVSIGTASQALNNRPNVAPETRVRVIDAAKTLGYPTKPELELVTAGIEVVGLLTKHDYGYPPAINAFYSHVQAGVESECRRQNLSLMYANVEVDSSNRPVSWPAMLSEERIDGLLLAGAFIKDTVGTLKRRLDIPLVLVDAYAPDMPYDAVLIDNDRGTCIAVEHLLKFGHRRIGLIGTNPASSPGLLERRASFCRLMRTRGLAETYIEDSELTQVSGYESLKRLLARAPEVTAVFAAADLVAIGALSAARDMGIAVPGQLSIIGFDNIDLAAVVTPALTTVHVHKTWMGALAVRQLLHRAAEPQQPRVSITLATQLVERRSVGVVRDQDHAERSFDPIDGHLERRSDGADIDAIGPQAFE
ncbi:MAG: LacI family transcriptional regulator [Anaerolineae bacterium]|nr:LacI family transcriptional regulator [Anaerolineae bacterium]